MSGFRLSNKKLSRIREYAVNSMYSLNAKSADCYSFTLCKGNEWIGGWDWTSNLSANRDYVLRLQTFELLKVIRDHKGEVIKLKVLKVLL